MSSAELTYWAAYYSREPWGYEADMWRMASQCAAMSNALGAKLKDGRSPTPKDFLPKRRRVRPPRADLPDWIKEKLETPDG